MLPLVFLRAQVLSPKMDARVMATTFLFLIKHMLRKKPLVNSLDGEVIGNTDVELNGSSNDEIEGPKDLQNFLQCLT